MSAMSAERDKHGHPMSIRMIGSRRKEKLDYLKKKTSQFACESGPIDKIPLLLTVSVYAFGNSL